MSETDPNPVLSPKKLRVIDALLSGASKGAAASAAGVTNRTLNRYLQEPAVRSEIDRATGAALGEAGRRMIGGMDTAVNTMLALLENEKTPATIKLRAATAVLEYGQQLYESHDLVKRLEALEARFESL